ncbi:MAG: isoprenylcysteine carboxylmethyltransferase family protein [Flavobacteriales bacterium]|nr:isoprenylcysteine carboxylmethyltransferase family protein [Flavobacteriales bacterium]
MIALAIAVAGGFVACWSRYVLGRNWSLTVQRKQGHQLVQHGPYSIIRHPIYTGLLLLFTGNALIVGDYRAILAVVIVLLSFRLKIRNEETLMAATFGAEYDTYRRRTKALVPFLL